MTASIFDTLALSGDIAVIWGLLPEVAEFLDLPLSDGAGEPSGYLGSYDVDELAAVVRHPDFPTCLDIVKRLHGLPVANKNIKPLADLEAEYEAKAQKILMSDLEFTELYFEEFLELIFERKLRNFTTDDPFEEIQSIEYRDWKRQSQSRRENEAIDYSAYRMWRYNPIVFYKEGKEARHRLLLKDDDETKAFIEGRQFAIMSPMTYVGRTNTYANSRYLYALAFDVDGIGVLELGWLLKGMMIGQFPLANIIVNSGHGVHLYYILERPVPMFERNIELMNKLKHKLTNVIWTISAERAQHQGINQGFRLPGTLTKFGKPIRAFWCSHAPTYTPASLNEYLGSIRLPEEDFEVLKTDFPYDPSKVTLAEAKKLWPEWYAAKVIGKKRVVRKWHVNEGLYYWWLNVLKTEGKVTVHHRYWCMLTLVVCAVKCDIPYDTVRKDAYALLSYFDSLTDSVDNHFTAADIEDALKAYDEGYNKWPVSTIETTTDIRIERCRRNGRGREKHIKVMNVIRDNVTHPDGVWRKGNGRKAGSTVTPEDSRCAAIVRAWQEQNPDCRNKAKCARETGLSRPTVHKWWMEI